LWSFGTFFRVLVCWTKKNLTTLVCFCTITDCYAKQIFREYCLCSTLNDIQWPRGKLIFFRRLFQSRPPLDSDRVARFFLTQKYQNGEKYIIQIITTLTYDHKIYEMAVKYSKLSSNIHPFSILMSSKIYPNWDFWFENIPSGNPGIRTSECIGPFVAFRLGRLCHRCLRKINNAPLSKDGRVASARIQSRLSAWWCNRMRSFGLNLFYVIYITYIKNVD
jgi:hypothetical protein